MRTTVTLTPEADGVVRRLMRERELSFKDAINAAILGGAPSVDREPYRLPSFDLRPLVPLDDVTGLLNSLDDEEFLRKRDAGK
jgi:hypothetical protein